ncbi:MAG: hypothetical protein U1C55_00275 [Smithellaceae bacterium]|nr:hypothetical protein [Smithellaceae bacterium]
MPIAQSCPIANGYCVLIRHFGGKTHARLPGTLLGHADVKITEIYTHVMARDIRNL